MRAVVGYVRVSTARQADEGVSLDAQRFAVKSWATVRGWSLAGEGVYADLGISGKKASNRPGLQAALDVVSREKGVLVFYSLSRLARSTKDALAIADRLEKAGADLASLTEPFDTTTPAGRMFFTMLAAFGQFEREMIGERTKAGMDYKRGRSERLGQVPFGKRLAADGVALVDDAGEGTAVAVMRGWRDSGWSLARIAAELDALGVATKGGSGRWSPSSVRSILQRG